VGATWADADDGPRFWQSRAQMFAHMLRTGGVWYAHNGGHYDVLFFLPELLRRRARFRCQQARIIAADVEGLSLRDSVKLIPTSLKEAGKALGLPKLERCGDPKHDEDFCAACERGYREARDNAETREYLARDCEILRVALRRVRVLMDVDKLPFTLAAYGIDRVKEAGHEPLVSWRDVENAPGPMRLATALQASERWRPWMQGGRVEVFTPRLRWGYGADIHSSYTRSVFDGLPGQPHRRGEFSLYRASVKVPDMDVPPLPYRAGERLFFPTGEWVGHYCEPELEAAESAGVKVRLITRHRFAREDAASILAREWWAKREDAEGFERLYYKCLLNWTWGKFGEHPEHEDMLVTDEPDIGWREYSRAHGIFLRDSLSVPRLAHVAAAAWITSHARARLWRALDATPERAYCDTDCVWAPAPPPVEYGPGCGQWGRETWKDARGREHAAHEDCLFAAPKVYAAGPKARAKGFSGVGGFARRATRSDVELLADGESVELYQFMKLRGRIKKGGDSLPLIGRMKKRVRLEENVPKRAENRPWSVNELAEKIFP
jgi:hypothetical protein